MVNNLLKTLTVLLVYLICLQPWLANAQEISTFPAIPLDSRTLRIQDQADKVYERTDYKRAFFIYRNELAPIGDKYAQYMVGFMYLAGKGVSEDRVAASAWYRLAAERGTKEFVGARDALMATLDAGQRARSDQLFLEMRKEYGDLPVLVKTLRKDYAELHDRTGSRLSSDTSPVAVINPGRPSASRSGTGYYDQIERRIKARLDYIARHTQIEIIDVEGDTVDLDSIEAQVSAYLNTLD